jgi:hypothetical protein
MLKQVPCLVYPPIAEYPELPHCLGRYLVSGLWLPTLLAVEATKRQPTAKTTMSLCIMDEMCISSASISSTFCLRHNTLARPLLACLWQSHQGSHGFGIQPIDLVANLVSMIGVKPPLG